ncbi:MAG: hypothetical protein WBM35_04045, partial [Candidatus Electrothrix sp.]
MKKIIISALLTAFYCGNVLAAEDVSGTFEAVKECEAYNSFKKKTNPGQVTVKKGKSYKAVEV